jgi:hypothetical protein
MSLARPINVYICPLGHETVTVDRADGVTPFMLRCRTEGCKEPAESSFYAPEVQSRIPQWEWFKPMTLRGYGINMREHIARGGLDIRRIEGDK